MENQKFQFKTNINCSSCVAKVTPYLEEAKGIESWQVDTMNRDKILTVNIDGAQAEEIINAVKQAGFNIEQIES